MHSDQSSADPAPDYRQKPVVLSTGPPTGEHSDPRPPANRSTIGFSQILVALAIALLLGPGCAQEPSPPLRIGINAWPGYEFIYLAQEKGFYQEEGVDVRVIEFNSLADARRAFERGQLDGLGTTVVETLQARENSSRKPQIVQVVDASHGADVILARPGITNLADLRGKKVGVELASLGVFILARGLEKHRLQLADVTPVSMDQTSMEDAFRTGELDAIVTYPPVSIRLLRDAKAGIAFSTGEIPGEVLDVIAIEETVLQSRGPEVDRFLRAFQRAMNYTRDHPEESHRIMAAREGITPQEFASSLSDGIVIYGAKDQAAFLGATGRLAQVIETVDRVLRQSGQLAEPAPVKDLTRTTTQAHDAVAGSPP